MEATITTRQITLKKTCFDYVIASLSPEVATEIHDLILKPPEATPYKVLKEQLIHRTAASEQHHLQQMFNTEELGDRKPTQLLRRMQQLLGDRASTTDSTFLHELFLQQLPHMILASTSTTATVEELAKLADKVVEVVAPTVAATSASPCPNIITEIEQLRAEVQILQTSVQQLARQLHGRSQSRSRQHSPAPQEQTTCWYHQRYGSKAKKCTPPCNYTQPSNDQASR